MLDHFMCSMHPLPSIFELPLPNTESEVFKMIDSFAIAKMGIYPLNITNNSSNIEQPKCQRRIKGVWKQEEDEKLKKAVQSMSPVVWDVVAEHVPGRTPLQCRERWRYRLSPDIKKTRFEHWEDSIIIKEQKRLGNKWTLIANKLPGRTSCAVKNRWYSVLNKTCKH